MKIVICDDSKLACDKLDAMVKCVLPDVEIKCFQDIISLQAYIKTHTTDLLFMDIDLGNGVDGMHFVRELRQSAGAESKTHSTLPLIIFVTALAERMPEAFSVRAFWYLVKPLKQETLREVLIQAESEIETLGAVVVACKLEIKINGNTTLVSLSDILYIESIGRKIRVVTRSGEYESYAKIIELEERLPKSFFKIHRSYIVNFEQVSNYSSSSVELTNGTTIPISKYKYKEFVNTFLDYQSGNIL
ncbi:LytR/AlgR family response regulator transcription factor [Pseudobutyrivibrio xylanivorans]|uniref:Stage 0 sporulation protein A homolog n=1 Tax=Pseudobutyrivibrio xylanivorans DSM 14809 TaxID=1123012 RepID=A0A1M6LJA4_PSEXY|nr:LytTR family DNA-binding domain-containing protein [Pseudobutyrivibrio xylanivorans]SHJ71242.1 two component transcriptional regulator, LytTR family [Pseudobutyrivibrio xylanivorans DSM 14809]